MIERVPPSEPEKPAKDGFFDPISFDWSEFRQDYDDRDITLKIDPGSIKVHVVEAVSFRTDEYEVKRYR